MGSSIAVVHRPSLQVPPEDADVTAQRKGIQTMTRVSAFHSTSPMGCEFVEGPPDWLLDQLAAALRTRLNLQLFNFDLVRPTRRDVPGIFQPPAALTCCNFCPVLCGAGTACPVAAELSLPRLCSLEAGPTGVVCVRDN